MMSLLDEKYIRYVPDEDEIRLDAEEQFKAWVNEMIDPRDLLGTMHNLNVYYVAGIALLNKIEELTAKLTKHSTDEVPETDPSTLN